MMTRFVLATTTFCFTFAALAGPALTPAPAKANPVYVKIIWPVDPADRLVNKNGPVVELWVAKSLKDRPQGSYKGVTAWVPLIESPDEAMAVWDGFVGDERHACPVDALILARKDGNIKILLQGWSPVGGSEVTVTLDDEPGSREVTPVTNAKTRLGIPHVAIMIGP